MKSNNIYQAEQIKVLDGLEAVRKRPSMYIGNTSVDGFHHLVYEVVDNSIDEALAGHCSKIHVTIHKNNSVTVEDNGRGIPVDIHPTEKISALELVMTTLHAGGKFDNSSYKVSGGLHGVGISVVNALSDELDAVVKRNGTVYRQSYKKGVRISEVEEIGTTTKTGTRITFHPDPDIFLDTREFDYEIIQKRIQELAFLNNEVAIYLKDERSGAYEEFAYEGGIPAYVLYLNRKKNPVFSEPIFIEEERAQVQVAVAFQYFDGYVERMFSFVNNIHTKEGGAHVSGFRSALTKCLNRYATDDIVPKNLRERMSGDDVREGLTCVVSVRVPEPQFEGQTKTKLGNSEVKSIVDQIVFEKLTFYLEQHPDVAKKILQKVVETARAREAARRARELSRKKDGINLLMAGKLAECQEKKPNKRELFIVEGDSAGGSAKQGRDRKTQAILPLRGKIMNVEKARFDKLLASEEIKQIIAALGTGIGTEGFDLEKLRYHKIIIMTDADVDGAHIRTLLLTFFYRQMISLLEGGYIYIGQPPLYRLGKGKQEMYFKDEEALNSFLFQRAEELFTIEIIGDEKPSTSNEADILRKLEKFYAIVQMLERKNYPEQLTLTLLRNNIFSCDQFEKKEQVEKIALELKKQGFSIGTIKTSSHRPSCYDVDIICKNTSSQYINLGPQVVLLPEYRHCLKLYEEINGYMDARFILRMNEVIVGDDIGWKEMLDLVRSQSFKGYHLQRYKGLGEMNPEQLWETTMNPDSRTLIKVQIEDAEKADDIFTTLMGDIVEPRREFIKNHALDVSLLDI